jgi:hypothetical protein
MSRFNCLCGLSLCLFLVGCGGGTPVIGPQSDVQSKANQADIDKSMQQSLEKMKEMQQKSGQAREVPNLPQTTRPAGN